MRTEKYSMISNGIIKSNILLAAIIIQALYISGKHNVKNNYFVKTNPILSLANPLRP